MIVKIMFSGMLGFLTLLGFLYYMERKKEILDSTEMLSWEHQAIGLGLSIAVVSFSMAILVSI